MAIFGFGKDKKAGGSSEQVMAYLEDAQRVRSPFLIMDSRKVEVSTVIQALDEESGTMSFQAAGATFEKGAKASFLFMQESLRLGGTSRVVETRSSLVVLEIPDELELMERRKLPRARLNPKEGATLTALTGLFEGVGITGVLESVSEGGCRIRVEKALNIKDEKRLPLGTALLPKGQAFMLLKLNKLPKSPSVMELTGKVAYLDDSGGGLAMGVAFEKPRADFAQTIRNLVSSRSAAIPTSIPPKTRRKAAAEEDSLLATSNERQSRSKPEEGAVAEPPRPAPREEKPQDSAPPPVEPAAPVLASAPPEAAAESPSPAKNQALLRLKKRTRTVVVMAPSAYGQLLRDFLLEEGYGRILVAANRDELASFVRQPNVGLVFVDSEMPVLECFEMIASLHQDDQDMAPVIVAAEEVSRGLVLAAHRAGVAQLVVKPYVLDESFSTLLEQQMGL